ncbi:MAG UNVERIFIED_CONTAM: hypothetical protein LVQ98_01045 [Rickettsiaceae bacterium]|jgi:hypothetical protein
MQKRTRNRIIIIIALGIMLYSALWIYVGQNAKQLLINQLGVRQEQILLSGYPANIRFQILDHEEVRNVSFGVFSKKLSLHLTKAVPSIYQDKVPLEANNWTKIDVSIISAQFSSYLALAKVARLKTTRPIDVFNAMDYFEYEVSGIQRDEALRVDLPIYFKLGLELPGKISYNSFEDIYKDIPKKLLLDLTYNKDITLNENSPNFIKKLVDQAKCKVSLAAVASLRKNPVDLSVINAKSILHLLTNLELDLKNEFKSKGSLLSTSIVIKSSKDSHDTNIKILGKNDDKEIGNIYKSFTGEDLAEYSEYALQGSGLHLTDGIKNKLRLLGDSIIHKVHNNASLTEDYWGKFATKSAAYNASLKIPKKISDPITYAIYVSNNDNYELKLDGEYTSGDIIKGNSS